MAAQAFEKNQERQRLVGSSAGQALNQMAGARFDVQLDKVGVFKQVIGDFPFVYPNVETGSDEQIQDSIAKVIPLGGEGSWLCAGLCCLTGIGCCYVCNKQILIDRGEYGFAMNNGFPEIFFSGRQVFMNPLIDFRGVRSVSENYIREGPMHIVRIPDGSVGLAMLNGQVQILLPGMHVRNDSSFIFDEREGIKRMDADLISIGPIKIFTVKSGTVRVCYDSGKVHVFTEGRYAVNSNTFTTGPLVNTQQQNFRFSKHKVLLDGGVSMFVEGLLTFQVSNVEKLVYQLGMENLSRAIESITEAEMSRVFAALHFEQISSPSADEDDAAAAVAAKGGNVAAKGGATNAGIRQRICDKVVAYITPIVSAWGVVVNAFQLESTTLADAKYAADYEQASLQMAKAKSNLRAQESQNKIMLQTAQATADSVRIAAEGKKKSTVVQAEADAEGIKIRAAAQVAAARSNAEAMRIAAEAAARQRIVEAESRNAAAVTMASGYARTLALSNMTVAFADGLRADVLTIADGGVGSQVMAGQIAAGKVKGAGQ